MLRPDGTRLEVWGDPVAHSRSPQLHAAAYRVLGLEWTYERRQVPEAGFAGELAGLSTAVARPVAHDAAQGVRHSQRRHGGTGAPSSPVP